MRQPIRKQQGENSSSNKNLYAANPVTLLDGSWLLVTDPNNVGREQKWFMRPSPEAKPARVPGIFQEVFPGSTASCGTGASSRHRRTPSRKGDIC